MISPLRRKLALLPLMLLPLGAVAACSSQGAETDCTINSCTVTFDRGVDAKASILGIEAELVGVQGQNVTMRIAGQEITVPRGQSEPAEGFNVSVESITQENVVVKISNGG